MRVACIIGLHRWGDWTYVSPDSCNKLPFCTRCGKFRSITGQTLHTWGHPEFAADQSCEQIQVCVRCRVTQPVVTIHEFGEWTRVATDRCYYERDCLRCGNREEKEEHKWVNNLYGETCAGCGGSRPSKPGLCFQCGQPAILGDKVCYACSH